LFLCLFRCSGLRNLSQSGVFIAEIARSHASVVLSDFAILGFLLGEGRTRRDIWQFLASLGLG